MTGLDKIVEQILEEADAESKTILEDANKKAEQIIADAKTSAEKIKANSDEKISMEKASGKSRAKSSSDLKKRQTVLKAKQEIINDIISKAYDGLINMEDTKYFEIMEKLVDKSVLPKEGEISFSEKDAKRLPKDFEKKVSDIAKKHGGNLVLSKKNANIDGGFILIYGGIEENCSITAMFNANKENMADKVNSLLFT